MKKTILSLLIALTLSFSAFAAVNINTASKAELETLNGIGANKATAIIKYRNGPKMEKKIGKDATVSGKTTVAAKETTKKKSNKEKSE